LITDKTYYPCFFDPNLFFTCRFFCNISFQSLILQNKYTIVLQRVFYITEEGSKRHIIDQGFVTILSLAGPTPIHLTGTFKDSSINSTYFLQLSGNASYDLICSIEDFHPGSVTYSTSTFSRSSKSAGNQANSFPSILYLTATLISGSWSRTSSLVRLRLS